MNTESLYIAADHGGYQLKKRLIRYIKKELNRTIEDLGAHTHEDKDDYPDYVLPLAEKVAKEGGRGIVICKNGIGANIAANKVRGIRAGIGYNIMAAETMMTDDNTNILALAAKGVSEDFALAIVKKWLETEFSAEERHKRRLEKIETYEKNRTV
jgi:ribose 5-phosphate isomerase B